MMFFPWQSEITMWQHGDEVPLRNGTPSRNTRLTHGFCMWINGAFLLSQCYVGCDLEAIDISCVLSKGIILYLPTGLLAKFQFSKDDYHFMSFVCSPCVRIDVSISRQPSLFSCVKCMSYLEFLNNTKTTTNIRKTGSTYCRKHAVHSISVEFRCHCWRV